MKPNRLLPILLVAALTACAVDPAPAPPGSIRARARSKDGRFKLELDFLHVSRVEGVATLDVRGEISPWSEDLLLSERRHDLLAVTPEGREIIPGRASWLGFAGGPRLTFAHVPLTTVPEGLASLTIGVLLLHVRRWETHEFKDLEPGRHEDLLCPPFELVVTAEAEACWVGAGSTDRSLEPLATRDLWRHLGHRWAAMAAEVVDADGTELDPWSAGGSGGSTAARFTKGRTPDEALPIAYPVTVRIRIPAEYGVDDVEFRFKDLPIR